MSSASPPASPPTSVEGEVGVKEANEEAATAGAPSMSTRAKTNDQKKRASSKGSLSSTTASAAAGNPRPPPPPSSSLTSFVGSQILMPPPSSVEEAGALLGAAITRCCHSHTATTVYGTILPPPGMHSSFATITPVPNCELFVRLASLRALLRTHDVSDDDGDDDDNDNAGSANKRTEGAAGERRTPKPLPAAPSLLPVLIKLLSTSQAIATTSYSTPTSSSATTASLSTMTAASAVSSTPSLRATSSSSIQSDESNTSNSSPTQQQQQQQQQQQHEDDSQTIVVPTILKPRRTTPPMLSTSLRKLWVDCIVLCHRLADHRYTRTTTTSSSAAAAASAATRVDTYGFVRKMMAVASVNPRSAKAAGGTRLAALEVIGGLFSDSVTAPRVAPWAVEELHLCHRGLRSSGSGEPYHRILSVRTACSVAVGCRNAALESRAAVVAGAKSGGTTKKIGTFIVRGAMEDKAIMEAVRLIRRAVDDRYPEVRAAAAEFASLVSPMLLLSTPPPGMMSSSASGSGAGGPGGRSTSSTAGDAGSAALASPLASVDEVMNLALKNIDDESAGVSASWAEALARCICVSIQYGENTRAQVASEIAEKRNVETESERRTTTPDTSSDFVSKFRTSISESRKTILLSMTCSSLSAAVEYLVDHFVKVGGELSASRCGGSYSVGGRASRTGISLALIHLLKLQSTCGAIGPSGLSMADVLRLVLNMVGPNIESQLQFPEAEFVSSENLDATASMAGLMSSRSENLSSPSSLFGSSKKKSSADAGLARLATARVIRRGLSEMASEPVQLAILRELSILCNWRAISSARGGGDAKSKVPLNRHQLEVALIEISHLIKSLGEAASSAFHDLIPALEACLSHSDHGVRHEAAIAYAAVAYVFPTKGRQFVVSSLDKIESHKSEVHKLANESDTNPAPMQKRRFRRSAPVAAKPARPNSVEKSQRFQHSIHGYALAVSLLLHELPFLSGGLPTELLERVMKVAETLVSCQYNEVLAKANPGAACSCVRAGYGVISGAFSVGSNPISSKIATVFGLWQKSMKSAEEGTKYFSPDHDLICLEAMLSSMLAFLKSCSELILAVPDVLNRTTLLLERVLPVVSPNGRLGKKPSNPVAASRLDSSKASIMDAFSWLPPGSYPMAADQLFSFAASLIKSGTEDEVACSILPGLLNGEDKLLDAQPVSRADGPGQVGGARDVEESIVSLASEAAHHGEREAVLHLVSWKKNKRTESAAVRSVDSPVLDLFLNEKLRGLPPTALHEVGSWREPLAPSSVSKVRLIDSAIHAFAACFGMKDGQQQQSAVLMLEALLPQSLVSGGFAVSSALMTETGRRSRVKQESVAVINVTTTLLACLQALPFHEATHDTPISMGPPWMNKTKDLFFMLLPTSSNVVRRAAAEGLGLLATLGVSEDAHTLQSSILHSLDEVMQGNYHDGTPRKFQLEIPSTARAGSLHTLACIQRTARNISEKEAARSRSRSSRSKSEDNAAGSAPPTRIMMTRVLPSLSTAHPEGDYFLVRTYALHSFGLLVAYAAFDSPSAEGLHILRKAVEVVEDNFLSAWTAVTADFDKGREGEKFAAEAAFLSVLLRLMTFLLPHLHLLKAADPSIASRFSGMAAVILETCHFHQMVYLEGLAFFERLATYQKLLSKEALSISSSGHVVDTCFSFILAVIRPYRPFKVAEYYGCVDSIICRRAAVLCLRRFCQLSLIPPLAEAIRYSVLRSQLFSLLEVACGLRSSSVFRSVWASRETACALFDCEALECEIVTCIEEFQLFEARLDEEQDTGRMIHWLLFGRALIAGSLDKQDRGEEADDSRGTFSRDAIVRRANQAARREAALVLEQASPSRWQVKCQAAKLASIALMEIMKYCENSADGSSFQSSPHFCPGAAQARDHDVDHASFKAGRFRDYPSSFVVFHLDDLIAASCSSATATLEEAELPSLQNAGLRLLILLVKCFGEIPDPELGPTTGTGERQGTSILEQFSSQIFSSIKHALGTGDDSDGIGEVSQPLFMSGCEALHLVAKKKLISDAAVLKRLARPVLPEKSELMYSAYPGISDGVVSNLRPKPPSVYADCRILILTRIGKLWTLAKLRSFADMGLLAEHVCSSFFEDVAKFEKVVAIHCAALALDGARILRGNGLSLCGNHFKKNNEIVDGQKAERAIQDQPQFKSGLTYANIENIDDMVKEGLVQTWPSLACNAVVFLTAAIKNEDGNTSEQTEVWLEKLIPVVFVGLNDAMATLNVSSSGGIAERSSLTWSQGLCPEETASMCVHAIRVLVGGAGKSEMISLALQKELGLVIHTLEKGIAFPLLGLPVKLSDMVSKDQLDCGSAGGKFRLEESTELLKEYCCLLEDVCCARVEYDIEFGGNSLLRAVLSPIAALQEGKISFEPNADAVSEILKSCMKSVEVFFESSKLHYLTGDDEEKLAEALLNISLQILSSHTEEMGATDEIRRATSKLLRDSLGHPAITTAMKLSIAQETAKAGNWEAWALVCSKLEDASGLLYSLGAIQDALEDLENPQRHLGALSAMRTLVQESPSEKCSLISCVMQGVGAEVIRILQAYGVLSIKGKDVQSNRVLACADSMKIVMIAFQNLLSFGQSNSDPNGGFDESMMSAFLTVVFEVLVSLIQFNGLPNHPSGRVGADPSLGKMSAHAIMHAARTAPSAFKSSMVNLTDEGRSVLELAVRAEMSGYAAPQPVTPAKKKLNLKGFTKV